MAETNLFTQVGDTRTVDISRAYNGTVTAAISAPDTGSISTGYTIILEVSANDARVWETATFTKPDKTTGASFTAPGSGFAEVPGYTHARLRLTAIGTVNQGVLVRLNAREG